MSGFAASNEFKPGQRVKTSVRGVFFHVPGTIVCRSLGKPGSYGVRLDERDPHGRVRIVERPAYAISNVREV